MARKDKTEYFIPDTCSMCVNSCKMYINVKFKESFSDSKSGIICKKYVKIKEPKTKEIKSKKGE